MLCAVTSVRNPVALAATCREEGINPPKQQSVRLDAKRLSGLVIYLPGMRFPVVVDVRTGLIFYHRLDNAFQPYALLMRFIYRFYAVQARLKRNENGAAETQQRPLSPKEAI